MYVTAWTTLALIASRSTLDFLLFAWTDGFLRQHIMVLGSNMEGSRQAATHCMSTYRGTMVYIQLHNYAYQFSIAGN